MPELPEVETLRKDLSKVVVGKSVKDIKVKWAKVVKPLTPIKFQFKIKDSKIKSVKRRAKILIFELSSGDFLIVHLKMTGQLIFQPKRGKVVYGGHPQKGGVVDLPNKYTRLIINFKDGSRLFFNDLRKFGWMRLVSGTELTSVSKHYGLEPLSKSFTLSEFKLILKRFPKRTIKQLLFDQSLIAGLGNIYIDESCFYARILPTRKIVTLTEPEITRLFKGIPEILNLSISKKGTSFSDYVQLDGKAGTMIKWLKVYNKAGQKCRRCTSTISKIKYNGRGTHFCPSCQV